ncbi:hypothetical protein J3R82DRAFT_10405 [Butyriboletus roseoflavus]|nr:hypothetical protein J3R82DRAFT_10405 [Butyriboletus roseoflavus]
MSNVDWQTAVRQEEEYLRKVHPTVDDIPGCMSLLDRFLLCHGACPAISSFLRLTSLAQSSELR